MTDRIFEDFGLVAAHRVRNLANTHWDHLIYAYLIENTRIYDIFAKVLGAYRCGEQLGTPSAEAQLFWRNTESLIYSDPAPTTIWSTGSRMRPDEMGDRMEIYWRMLGLELTHAEDVAEAHPYQKTAAANVDFVTAFEAFANATWRAIVNLRNTSGSNDTDNQAIATAAQRMHDMFLTRKQHGNISRQEFRAVAVMSWLHMAVSFDSPVVRDLSATAPSPEQRLFKIAERFENAERAEMDPHPQSQALFDLARPFSLLLRWIEAGLFNDIAGAEMLYRRRHYREVAEQVIGQYSIAMGHDVKATPVVVTKQAAKQAPSPQRLVAIPPARHAPMPAAATRLAS
jgi:hypothetical protein